MSRRRWLVVAGAGGVVALWASTLTTGAGWRSVVSLDGGELGSGSLVLLAGDATSQVKNYPFTALAGSRLTPGSAVQAPLVLRNGGTTALTYRLTQTTTTGSGAVAAQLRLRVHRVVGVASCPAGLDAAPAGGAAESIFDGALPGATTPARTVARSSSEVLCVRVTLSGSAPLSTQSSSVQTVFTFGAEVA